MNNLQTGDLLLFTEKTKGILAPLIGLIKWGTHSDFTHVAMVLKDPTFLHPSLKGTYVWESSWEGKPDPQDGKIKLGVQITPLAEIMDAYKNLGHVFVRKMNSPSDTFNDEVLSKIHDVVYNKPYDIVPLDWVEALFQKDIHPQKTSRFWCSALVAYIYTTCGILNKETDWSIARPSDFSLTGEGTLKYINNCYLENVITKIQ